jgi:multisubunit Na+/H+ antiporter MnhB subunit
MQKIKQAFYAAFAVALTTAPAVASAQWGQGRSNAQSSGLPVDSIYSIIMRTMNWLLAILGFIGIIGFVIAGILYLTAAGSEDQIEKAKSAMMYSILGIVVALIGFVIIKAVEGWLTSGTTQF